MTPRERLAGVLSTELLDALDAYVSERVAAELASVSPAGNGSPWLSLRDGAAYLGVSERSLERAVARGRLASTTVARRRLVHRDDLDAFMRRAAGEE